VLLCAGALSAACLFLYGRALEGFLLADDYTIIGSFWGKGVRYLLGLLASDEIGGVWSEQFVRPVRPWSLALDGWIWGLEPFGFHLTNLVLHAVTSALIAVLVLQLGGSLLPAFLASLLFLLHPVNVEVATWVSGRDESLACAPLLGVAACYFAAPSGRRGRWRALSCALFTASLLAKEYALLLPVGFWALALLAPAGGGSRLRALRNSFSTSIPLLAVIAAFLGLRFYAIGHPLGGYGAGAEAHATLRLDLLVDSVSRFAGDFFAPLAARPYVAAAFALGCLVPLAMPARTGEEPRPALVLFWAVLWPMLFLMPTHNLVYTPRHLYISFAGIAVAFGLLQARVRGKRQTRLAVVVGSALALLLAPLTLSAVDDFTRTSNRCRTALSSVNLASKSIPSGDVVVLVGMPAHESPPWGFGWSLDEALRPPFVEDALDSRLELVYRRLWRPEAWAAYRGKYPSRGIHVLAWNPAFNGIEFLRSVDPGAASVPGASIDTVDPGPEIRSAHHGPVGEANLHVVGRKRVDAEMHARRLLGAVAVRSPDVSEASKELRGGEVPGLVQRDPGAQGSGVAVRADER
jgi:hypothetical protein